MSVSALSASDNAAATALAGASSSSDIEQRFLKLLVTQLSNQDPLNPMDNAQLTSQLAQLSTVSGIEKMNASLQQLLGQNTAGQLLDASALVGRDVLAPGNALAAGNGPAGFAIDLPSAATAVKAVIVDGAGRAVRTIDLGALPAGLQSQSWDGLDDAGHAAAAGTYRVQVSASNAAAAVAATTLVPQRVASVAQGSAGVSLGLQGGGSAALADIRQVR